MDRRPLVWVTALAIIGCGVAVLSGLAASLTYTGMEPTLRSLGFTLQHFRALHDTFAFGWVFVGGAAIVYYYIYRERGAPAARTRRRMVWNLALWAVAGTGIVATLLAGRFSGREYLEYDPIFSVLIVVGWFLFARVFFEGFRGLSGQPVYIYMWSVGIVLFFVTFTEGHLYLLDAVSDRPVRDLAIQWKSAGTLVGSFNLLAYGALMYVACCYKGDHTYAYSRTAFGFFWVALLNTFTNYGHHTYHLPQSSVIHWTSFIVSMLEIAILAKILLDVMALRKRSTATPERRVPDGFMRSATGWIFVLLTISLIISVPPLNALIHGTHVVVAHSMGSMIGIDSMILWAGIAYIMCYLLHDTDPVLSGARVRAMIPVINVSLLVFLLSYLTRGMAAAWVRYFGSAAPDFSLWMERYFPLVMVAAGSVMATAVLWMLLMWLRALHPLAWTVAAEGISSAGPMDSLAAETVPVATRDVTGLEEQRAPRASTGQE